MRLRPFEWPFNFHVNVIIVASDLPSFTVSGVLLNYVSEFKFWERMITDKLSDVADIKCEMRFCCLSEHTFYYATSLQ